MVIDQNITQSVNVLPFNLWIPWESSIYSQLPENVSGVISGLIYIFHQDLHWHHRGSLYWMWTFFLWCKFGAWGQPDPESGRITRKSIMYLTAILQMWAEYHQLPEYCDFSVGCWWSQAQEADIWCQDTLSHSTLKNGDLSVLSNP